jgi:hypothetical protein
LVGVGVLQPIGFGSWALYFSRLSVIRVGASPGEFDSGNELPPPQFPLPVGRIRFGNSVAFVLVIGFGVAAKLLSLT